MEKIDLEELIKDYTVLNVTSFISYLKEIWKDLASRSDDKVKGVNRIIFSNVFFSKNSTISFLAFYLKDYFQYSI
jgi:hypothetical protein